MQYNHRKKIHISLIFLLSASLSFFISVVFSGNSVFLGSTMANMVGVTASIPENPYNSVAKQLRDKDLELQKREEELILKEQGIQEGSNEAGSYQGNIVAYSALGNAVLLIMIIFNFYLDSRRNKNNIKIVKLQN